MPWPQLATLDGIDLPPQFSYDPYIPRKRRTITPTSNAVVTQVSNPLIIQGDSSVNWNIENAFPTEFKTLWDLYNTDSDEVYTFEGYWGETLQVTFPKLDNPSVRGRLFSFGGQFQVLCFDDYNPPCNPSL